MRKSLLLLGMLAAAVLGSFTVAGLLPPNSPIPSSGEAGAPHRALSAGEQAQFLRGRALFDKDFLHGDGVGPQFNGDSCRACHQDPVIAGAGGIDVQVQRPAISDGMGGFIPPAATGPLAQTHHAVGVAREEIPNTVAFVEERNSPTLLGLGLVETISDATILANEDAGDGDGDGIFGIAHVLSGGAIGRFGWKASVPTLEDFVRDALGNEMGVTVPISSSAFGFTADMDTASDPEIPQTDIDDMVFFLQMLDFPPTGADTAEIQQGRGLMDSVGCTKCHVATMDGVELYSNLLLHNVEAPGFVGVTDGLATSGLYRTSPLRGLKDTAPYFHDGRSETLRDAIVRHDTEALAVRQAYEALTPTQKDALIAFLRSR